MNVLLLLHPAFVFGRSQRPNVLYVVVDDLRNELPIYGQSNIHAPNLVSLAARGVVFDNVYAQQAVCGPSRNSFMSGRRPVSKSPPAENLLRGHSLMDACAGCFVYTSFPLLGAGWKPPNHPWPLAAFRFAARAFC